jgi:hypothetical protein
MKMVTTSNENVLFWFPSVTERRVRVVFGMSQVQITARRLEVEVFRGFP